MTDLSSIVFEDLFHIDTLDKDGKKFDRGMSFDAGVSSTNAKVSRVTGKSDNYGMSLILDINSELYPININEKYTLVISRSLSVDGTMAENEGHFDATRDMSKASSLAKDYDYVMFGKVYKFDENRATGQV